MKMKKKRRRRLPALRRYARGEETRQRIVEAALEVFGARGYEAASTRLIAKQTGVTLPAFQYYFAGKQGLYMACAEYIAERMTTLTDPALTRNRNSDKGRQDRTRGTPEDAFRHTRRMLRSTRGIRGC